MPFRRKCEDELPPKHVIIPYARGEIGPFRPMLAGYRPDHPAPFGDSDPDGAVYLQAARAQQEQTRREAKKRKRKELNAKREPTESGTAILEAAEGWWEDVG